LDKLSLRETAKRGAGTKGRRGPTYIVAEKDLLYRRQKGPNANALPQEGGND